MSKFHETAKKNSFLCLFFPYSITAAVSFNTEEKIANLSTKQLFFSSTKIGLVEF